MARAGLFPGQANQYVGMGQSFYDDKDNLAVRQLYERASEITGKDLIGIAFDPKHAELQKQTKYTQLITALHEIAVHDTLTTALGNDHFDVYAGHSIGELVALYAAGVFESQEDAIKIINARADVMDSVRFDKPALIAIRDKTREELDKLAAESPLDVQVALYNSPKSYVIAGEPDDLAQFLDEHGFKKPIPLMNHPFHTHHYEEAAAEFEDFLRGFTFGSFRVPVICNVEGRPYNKNTIITYLVDQLTQPVMWEDTMQKIEAEEFVEMGPGKSLSGMLKRIRTDNPNIVSVDTLEDAKDYFMQVRERQKP